MAYDSPVEADYEDRVSPMKKPRYLEDDLRLLTEIEGKISDLLREREQRLQDIKDSHFNYKERIQASQDWFEGYVKGNPVPERGGAEVRNSGY